MTPPEGRRRTAAAGAFKFVDPEYPFLRVDETPDVLGKFFTIHPATPPNIVFILVEGLGKAFSGPNAYLGSFTPFLDKLAGESLYWGEFSRVPGANVRGASVDPGLTALRRARLQ